MNQRANRLVCRHFNHSDRLALGALDGVAPPAFRANSVSRLGWGWRETTGKQWSRIVAANAHPSSVISFGTGDPDFAVGESNVNFAKIQVRHEESILPLKRGTPSQSRPCPNIVSINRSGLESPCAAIVANLGIKRIETKYPMLFSRRSPRRSLLQQDHVECIESGFTNRANNLHRVCIWSFRLGVFVLVFPSLVKPPILPHPIMQVSARSLDFPDVYPILFDIHEQVDEVRGKPAKAIPVDGKDIISRMRPHMPAIAASYRVGPTANQNKTLPTIKLQVVHLDAMRAKDEWIWVRDYHCGPSKGIFYQSRPT